MLKQIFIKKNINLITLEHFKSASRLEEIIKKKSESDSCLFLIEANKFIFKTIEKNSLHFNNTEFTFLINKYPENIRLLDIDFNDELNYYIDKYKSVYKNYSNNSRIDYYIKYYVEKSYFMKGIYIDSLIYNTFILYRERKIFKNIYYYTKGFNSKKNIIIIIGQYHENYVLRMIENSQKNPIKIF